MDAGYKHPRLTGTDALLRSLADDDDTEPTLSILGLSDTSLDLVLEYASPDGAYWFVLALVCRAFAKATMRLAANRRRKTANPMLPGRPLFSTPIASVLTTPAFVHWATLHAGLPRTPGTFAVAASLGDTIVLAALKELGFPLDWTVHDRAISDMQPWLLNAGCPSSILTARKADGSVVTFRMRDAIESFSVNDVDLESFEPGSVLPASCQAFYADIGLTGLPPGFLPSGLVEFDASSCPEFKVPAEMWSLECLRMLDLSGCDILSGDFFASANLPALVQMDLQNNYLSDLPLSMYLPALQKLDLSGNSFKKIPEALKHCDCLVVLELDKCRLAFPELPVWFKDLANLRTLSMRDNRLTALKGELPLFIEEIFLSFNPLRSLPNLMYLQKLRRFDIRATGIGAEKSRVRPECVVIAVGRRTHIDYLSSDEDSEEDSE